VRLSAEGNLESLDPAVQLLSVDEYAQDLLENAQAFDHLVRQLPPEISSWSNEQLEQEAQLLDREDADATRQVRDLTQRAESLLEIVNVEIQDLCNELSSGTVTRTAAETDQGH